MTLSTILEPLQEMAYPKDFDMEHFKSLPLIQDKMDYLDSKLTVIGEGSSRRVYGVDEKRVIKMAMNGKGIGQNEAEIRFSKKQYPVCARVFYADPTNTFMESERAESFSDSNNDDYEVFSYYTGLGQGEVGPSDGMNDLFRYLSKIDRTGKDTVDEYYRKHVPALRYMTTNQWVQALIKFAMDNDFPIPGDFTRLSTYGVVKRRNLEGSGVKYQVVIVDYGFTREVYNNHYRR